MTTDPKFSTLLNEMTQRWRPHRKHYDIERIVQRTLDVQQIPAPTFEETERADYIESEFEKMNFDKVQRDELHNIYGWLGSPRHETVLLVSAHHDTVFPMETDLSAERKGTRCYGPGIGDNSLGVSALLLLAELLTEEQRPETHAVCFVANAREEGLGNLDGIKLAAEKIGAERIRAAVVIEGMALGRVYHAGIAVRRFKISATAEGGHSWTGFGKSSAVHGIAEVIHDITRLDLPSNPRSTFNVGVMSGGHSINSIATYAECLVDLRSMDTAVLSRMEKNVRQIVQNHGLQDLQFEVELIGERPAGIIPTSHPLVRLALASLHEIGIAGILEHGSTDANMLLAKQIPSVVVGITYGGNSHRLDEFMEVPQLQQGFWHLLTLVSALSYLMETDEWTHVQL